MKKLVKATRLIIGLASTFFAFVFFTFDISLFSGMLIGGVPNRSALLWGSSILIIFFALGIIFSCITIYCLNPEYAKTVFRNKILWARNKS